MASSRAAHLRFWKLDGAGNDFIGFDNRKGTLPEGEGRSALIRALCDRRTGVGTDGAIVLERPREAKAADVRMRYYNRDGGEAEMCGNGARCLALFASVQGAAPSRGMRIDTIAGIQRADVLKRGMVRLYLPDVGPLRHHARVESPAWSGPVDFVWVGVPHAIVWVDNLEGLDVDSLGRTLRHHAVFSPHGANINFASPALGNGREGGGAGSAAVRRGKAESSEIAVRTYERGVESETLACGTGSVAAAFSAVSSGRAKAPVTIRVRGGVLRIGLAPVAGGGARKVTLTGPARIVFSGITTWNPRSRVIDFLET